MGGQASIARIPIDTIFPACCARAASGHAAAPPSRAINSRRLMSNTGLPPLALPPVVTTSRRRPPRTVHRAPNLPREGGQILGPGLNCSESSLGAAGFPCRSDVEDSTPRYRRRPLHGDFDATPTACRLGVNRDGVRAGRTCARDCLARQVRRCLPVRPPLFRASVTRLTKLFRFPP
jgi:hypothetical protein